MSDRPNEQHACNRITAPLKDSGNCASHRGGLGYGSGERITDAREVDAAYIYLTDAPLFPGRDSIPCGKPDDVEHAFAVMDERDGRIVGLEVLDASKLLHPDLLAGAESR